MRMVKAETSDLKAAGSTVVSAAESLRGTTDGLVLDSAARDMTGSITAALLPSFAAEWRQNVQQLAAAVRTTGEHLQAAATVYSALDRSAAEMLADLELAVLGGGE
ncbi:type VII secretion target [Saccharopolyspora elongata]|uniref:Excreted virulence factor EspC, type VII ESX diderm n=1 Tax=Saccharopolyspora elongata TaxID=2530387 RepID=A0A4R4ZDL6_9PSEU|nr:type VII secretion target [Saccharopolyspora elongata]TDD56543.1 hypothetical protein E1288_00145 [Saccharopolyspora elongata]